MAAIIIEERLEWNEPSSLRIGGNWPAYCSHTSHLATGLLSRSSTTPFSVGLNSNRVLWCCQPSLFMMSWIRIRLRDESDIRKTFCLFCCTNYLEKWQSRQPQYHEKWSNWRMNLKENACAELLQHPVEQSCGQVTMVAHQRPSFGEDSSWLFNWRTMKACAPVAGGCNRHFPQPTCSGKALENCRLYV